LLSVPLAWNLVPFRSYLSPDVPRGDRERAFIHSPPAKEMAEQARAFLAWLAQRNDDGHA
jgi:hypothetical protein